MISSILFDFSGTLVTGRLDIRMCRESVVELLRSRGHKTSLEQYDLAMGAALDRLRAEKMAGRELPFEEVEGNALRMLGIDPTPELVSRIEDVEFEHYNWRLRPGVGRLLEDLVTRYRLGIISNSRTEAATKVLRKEGILGLFSVVVLSRDVGYRKPHPYIFAYALDRLGAKAEEVAFVGDSFEEDILGAKRMGMRAIWLTDGWPDNRPHLGIEVESITKLPILVEKFDCIPERASFSRSGYGP